MSRISLKYINERISSDPAGYIAECESDYDKRIRLAADAIKQGIDKTPIVLLSGPSGSGKTTTALKIEALLDAEGLETHTVSMDNYFLPHDGSHELDLEAPARLDIELFTKHLKLIAEGAEIEVPIFNFVTQQRDGVTALKRHKNELVLVEGIHALNPEVTGESDEYTKRLYVCPSHGVSTCRDLTLHTAGIRLLRRLTRDYLFRARSFDDTLSHFSRVERGANLYVIPFKSCADIVIDTFLPYEICAYKEYCRELLGEIPSDSINKTHATELYDILKLTCGVDEKLIPAGSLVREFIGGSSFSY